MIRLSPWTILTMLSLRAGLDPLAWREMTLAEWQAAVRIAQLRAVN